LKALYVSLADKTSLFKHFVAIDLWVILLAQTLTAR
jgi:hypothetical protein